MAFHLPAYVQSLWNRPSIGLFKSLEMSTKRIKNARELKKMWWHALSAAKSRRSNLLNLVFFFERTQQQISTNRCNIWLSLTLRTTSEGSLKILTAVCFAIGCSTVYMSLSSIWSEAVGLCSFTLGLSSLYFSFATVLIHNIL